METLDRPRLQPGEADADDDHLPPDARDDDRPEPWRARVRWGGAIIATDAPLCFERALHTVASDRDPQRGVVEHERDGDSSRDRRCSRARRRETRSDVESERQ